MGNKITTEEDFWICSEGAVPTPFQGTRKGLHDSVGHLYITKEDKSTVSWIDFGCKKYMLLMAIAAAIVVVVAVAVGVITVATGGLGLIALGAIAGLAGGAIGAVVGGLLCGQKMSSKRQWISNKPDMILQGTPVVTGGCTMTCAVGGVVQFAPNVKTWLGAVGYASLSYSSELVKCAFAGAAVGTVGSLLGVGSVTVAGTGGTVGTGMSLSRASMILTRPGVSSVLSNIGASFGIGTGSTGAAIALGSRGIFGAESAASTYATGATDENGNPLSVTNAFAKGALPEYEFGSRMATQGISGLQWSDALLGLYLLNIKTDPRGTYRGENGQLRNSRNNPRGQRPGSIAQDPRTVPPRNGRAFEDTPAVPTARLGELAENAAIAELRAEGYTDIVQVQNNSGHGVDVIGKKPDGSVKCLEVKANTSRLEGDQLKGGQWYVRDRLRRAINGESHYGVPPNPADLPIKAQQAQDWIDNAPHVEYEQWQIDVDGANSTTGNPNKNPW